MTPVSSRKQPISHSVSQSADSASYYVDGSIDQTSPFKSHDFAAARRPDLQSPGSPKSPRSYLDGQYDYESAAEPFTPSKHDETNVKNTRASDSSSMFGTLPGRTLLENVHPPFSVNGTGKEDSTPTGKEMPGSFQDTPGLSKMGETSAKKRPEEASYFNADGELKERVASQRDDVSIGEAF